MRSLAWWRGLRAKRDLLVRGLNAIDGIKLRVARRRLLLLPRYQRSAGAHGRGRHEQVVSPSGCSPEQHTAVLAGTAFGPGGEGHLRLCYATEPVELERALAAIRRLVGALARFRPRRAPHPVLKA